jgi:glycine cleavage system transcriptional repressor
VAHLAVIAMGADRPGIVAAVTGVLVERGCNLDDTSMSILRGHFAMMLVVEAPDDLGADALEAELSAAAAQFDLVVAVRRIDDDVPTSPPGEPWTLAVYGADRPGIVHRVTTALAALDVNVTDMTTRVIGDDERPVYAMVLAVTVPAGHSGDEVRAALDGVAAELGVDCTLHPAEPDLL